MLLVEIKGVTIIQRLRAVLLAAAVAVVLSSCQSNRSETLRWNVSDVDLVWPLPPDLPRIQYVGQLTSRDSLGATGGIGQALRALVLGKKETNLVKPVALAKNSAGLLVVADPGIPTLHFFDLENNAYWRPKIKHSESLMSPVGIALSDAGKVYVADSIVGKILVFDLKGRPLMSFGEEVLVRPTGIALNRAQDRLYVVDTINNQVSVFDTAGKHIKSFGSRGTKPGQFNYPTYITALPDGRICVSDSLNFRVQLFDKDGSILHQFGRAGNGAGTFSRPKGVAADSHGALYIVDAAFENVQIFKDDGSLLLAFGNPGTGPGEFTLPVDIFLDSNDTIWVADSFNQRIVVFRLLGESP